MDATKTSPTKTAPTSTPIVKPQRPKPTGRPPRSPEQIWDVDDGCWNYRGTVDKTGYGVVDVQQRQWRANRYMYHMWYKVDIEDQLVCHTCDSEKYANKKKTQVQLGEEYGVGQSTISAIVLGKYWRQYL